MSELSGPRPGWQCDLLARRSVEIKMLWDSTDAGPDDRNVPDPTLSLEFPDGLPAGRWLFLRYSANYRRPLRRPVLGIETSKGCNEDFIPAPLFGSASWLGFIPQDTQKLWISPGAVAQSDFQIEFVASLRTSEVIRLALPCNWKKTFHALLLLCMKRQEIACKLLELILNAKPLSKYNRWRLENERAFSERQDMPADACKGGPLVCFLVDLTTGSESGFARTTIESLNRQVYPKWAVLLVGESRGAAKKPAGLDASRVFALSRQGALHSWLEEHAPQNTIVAPIAVDDVLPEYAAALVAEHMRANPDQHVAYADEDSVDHVGRFVDPQLKPDWSPTRQAFSEYVGRAVYFRADILSRQLLAAVSALTGPDLFRHVMNADASRSVGHIRRVLLTRASTGLPRGQQDQKSSVLPPVRDVRTSVIIPSRDRAQLLEACLSFLDCKSTTDIEVIVVDNGSVESETKRLYEKLRQDSRVTVHSAPGPFNFSELCNTGAAVSGGDVLIFLNNDTIAPIGDWRAPLLRWALCDDVGAVGARLLYPDGLLQHGGIVIGMPGYAGHVDTGAPGDHSGYLNRLKSPHEVAAVTGACLAVQRSKFVAVGGFDEKAFPIEFSDVDLCLRLREAGWKTMVVPEVTLIHHESATRGYSRVADPTDAKYRAAFCARWWRYIRDDPYFHPALSLRTQTTMLG